MAEAARGEERAVCGKCWSSIPTSAMFCTGCGNIQIRNSLIIEKTTAAYDPRGKDYKPWREIGPVAPNSWKERNSTVLVRKRQPWRPAMNQSHVFLKKGKGKPSLVSWPDDESKEIVTKRERRLIERTSSKRIIAYRGRLWSKSGDVYRKKKTIFTPGMMYGYEPKAPQPVHEVANELPPPISLFPLGIYPLDWLSTETWTCSVHLTLLRRSFQSKHHHTLATHWLRVGYSVERIVAPCSSEGTEEEREHRFIVVDYLPNSIAKCLGAALQGSWVDLKYVSRHPHLSPLYHSN
jgi:hypothetical protein